MRYPPTADSSEDIEGPFPLLRLTSVDPRIWFGCGSTEHPASESAARFFSVVALQATYVRTARRGLILNDCGLSSFSRELNARYDDHSETLR